MTGWGPPSEQDRSRVVGVCPALHEPSGPVGDPMVMATEKPEVLDVGGPGGVVGVRRVVVDVVCVAAIGVAGATGEDAAAVADEECLALVGVRVAVEFAHSEDVAVFGDLEEPDESGGEYPADGGGVEAVPVGTELRIEQAGIPDMIPVSACYLGWQESLTLLAKLVEAEIPD